jgi:hypothetical protein
LSHPDEILVAVFYVSFVLVVGMVLLQVVIAVLLGAFIEASATCAENSSPKARDDDEFVTPLPLQRLTQRLGLPLMTWGDYHKRVDDVFVKIATEGLMYSQGYIDPSLDQKESAEMESLRKQVHRPQFRLDPSLDKKESAEMESLRKQVKGLKKMLRI